VFAFIDRLINCVVNGSIEQNQATQ